MDPVFKWSVSSRYQRQTGNSDGSAAGNIPIRTGKCYQLGKNNQRGSQSRCTGCGQQGIKTHQSFLLPRDP